VSCPRCGFENPPGFKFCGECAVPLAPPESAAPVPDPRSYTPKHLADRILSTRSALEGERKQVTVLFADVSGSVALQEGIDPEEWHGVMDRFFQILADAVHRFEGTINQYTGDGIMPRFGAPIAHEDHAQRACYTALQLSDEVRRYADELRRERGLSFSARMGINSGEVVVGKIGDDLRMDYTAQGQTVNVASRVEEVAAPDRAYLGENTAKLVEGYFELRSLGAFDLKGVREPVPVYELQGIGKLRTRLDVSRARGFSRFVGRAEEMRALEAALARAEKGNPQIIGIVGDAGVGKSRLCFEFLERCRARGTMAQETHGVSHGKAIPFLPILKLFRSFFGITERDSDATAREKIAGRLLLLDETFRETLPVLFDFLGVASPDDPAPRMDPEARQRQLFAVVRGVIQARAGLETTVALLEDLHWFDGGSEAFLEPLLDAPPGARRLIVVNFRPEYHADWMQKSVYQQLPLQPLGPEAITDLLNELLGNHPSVAGLGELIRDRTRGNPFFIEEVVKSLAESGSLEGSAGSYRLVKPVADVAVPASVQGILASRIDHLPERDKQVLQTAAVIGRKFPESILTKVMELPDTDLAASLASLQSGEFIYQETLYPEAEYAFKHPLTEEVAYGSQLGERRRRIHGEVARAIQGTQPEKLDEQAPLLAYHWERAEELLEAAQWHRRAAEWAGVSDLNEAIRHWQSVRALVGRLSFGGGDRGGFCGG
jgi:class 3 adenylate cyclase